MGSEFGAELVSIGLAAVAVGAVVAGGAHALLLAWLTRRLLCGSWPHQSARMSLTLLPLMPRLVLALLGVLAFWLGGIGAGLGALAGFWVARTTVMLTISRLGPE